MSVTQLWKKALSLLGVRHISVADKEPQMFRIIGLLKTSSQRTKNDAKLQCGRNVGKPLIEYSETRVMQGRQRRRHCKYSCCFTSGHNQKQLSRKVGTIYCIAEKLLIYVLTHYGDAQAVQKHWLVMARSHTGLMIVPILISRAEKGLGMGIVEEHGR